MILTELFDGYTPALVLLVSMVFLLAGVVKGVVGLGLPTISMALLSIFMAPAHAAALLVIPSLVTNVWQTRPFSSLMPLLQRIGGMQAGVVAGTLAGAVVLGAPAGAWAAMSLGVALLAYSAWAMFGRPFTVPAQTERWLGPIVGALTGFITAATGVFVVPAVPYLQSLGLARDELIQAMGVSFTVSTVALAAGLWLNDSYSFGTAGASLFMLAPALAGMAAGTRLRHSLAPSVFRRCFLVSLAVVGVYLFAKGWL
ncbi:sulfite exporter TauE/SafE family protein [Pusillimonas sp. MFBS29]|uniref:sulfite exporter TauE/SafE family protein n=1 Tax=Pusillimonas sp. MFBS29 TaxID=2886690 RepID=UPI001D120CB8|nr:sulfite exporter TauE/SafE family protein [Pusillimonas sp. MFBS29]MCC2596471.1 sulfite exporter TauE/SafE family protein [Pusillimonas sp. MFBS29]